jgi:hypothetical protein
LSTTAFLDLLFSDDRGWCFACNMLDSIQESIFPIKRLRRLMANVLLEFENDRANVRTAAEAIGLVQRVASGFWTGPAERHVLAAVIASPKPEGTLAHVLRSQTLARWTQDIADPHLIPDPSPPRTSAAVSAYERLVHAINEEIIYDSSQVFDANATIGYDVPLECQIGLVWFTRTESLAGYTDTGDDLRDVLGLDIPLGNYLLIAEFDETEPHKRNVARPTFADGGNARFRVVSDGATDEQWGTTVHLGKLYRDEFAIDGAPERVVEKIPLRSLRPRFTPIGWVDSTRGTSATDSDLAFKERIVGECSEVDIRAEFVRLLT